MRFVTCDDTTHPSEGCPWDVWPLPGHTQRATPPWTMHAVRKVTPSITAAIACRHAAAGQQVGVPAVHRARGRRLPVRGHQPRRGAPGAASPRCDLQKIEGESLHVLMRRLTLGWQHQPWRGSLGAPPSWTARARCFCAPDRAQDSAVTTHCVITGRGFLPHRK